MRTPETCKFIAARVIREWVTERTPILPLLVEAEASSSTPCRYGHADGRTKDGQCLTCNRERSRARRARYHEARS